MYIYIANILPCMITQLLCLCMPTFMLDKSTCLALKFVIHDFTFFHPFYFHIIILFCM